MKNVLTELFARKLIHDCTDRQELEGLPSGSTFYYGVDPTAPSLHIGNLVGLIVSIHLAQAGYKPIILVGGATGSIGDPSGRNSERELLSLEAVRVNEKKITDKIASILGRAGVKAQMVNNYDWTIEVPVLDFLRDVGKHFTVNYMLGKDVVQNRMESEGISFTEFSYMLLQAFDYLHLYNSHGCRLQLGGSDQWGNITAGLELIRKKGLSGAHAFSFPLILDSEGRKLGKSTGGGVWLSEELTSPYKLHQSFLNLDDVKVIDYLKVFTFIPLNEIEDLEARHKEAPEKREAQRVLADSLCTLIHGEEATARAKACAQALFGGVLTALSPSDLEEVFVEAPKTELTLQECSQVSLLDLFVKAGLAISKSEARRLVQDGGAYLNNERVEDGTQPLSEQALLHQRYAVLRAGKKKYGLVRVA